MTLSNEEIVGFLNQYERESKAFREETLRMCWYMRGGITYDEAMLLSQQERELIGKLVEDNMETTKRSGLPFF